MNSSKLTRKFLILVGDILSLYLALFLMIRLSYGDGWLQDWHIHFRPFSWIFPIWILTFYATYLYETRFFRFGVETLRTISTAVFIAFLGSVTAFYAFPPGLIHPRRDMVLFVPILMLLLMGWRYLAYKIFRKYVTTHLVFLGHAPEIKELEDYFKQHPQLGYHSKGIIEVKQGYIEAIERKIKEGVRLVVINIPANNTEFNKQFFSLLSSQVAIIDLEEFYERVLNKVSPSIINEAWFIKNLESLSMDFYKLTKRVSDIVFAIFGLIITIPLYPLIAIWIKMDSSGPIFLKQTRVGKNNIPYSIYKFRTMKAIGPGGSAEAKGPIYATPEDKRITGAGRFLRISHIDELPQLWNILGGSMSLVGPRPIRPEFVEKLRNNIPYYDMRHLVKPGLTGWAQINYGYGITIKDEYIKLQYDIYYAKKQSIILDIAIVLKTIKGILLIMNRHKQISN